MKKPISPRRYMIVVLVIIALVFLTGCSSCSANYTKPISGFSGVMDILVWPIAGLMYGIGKSIGFGYYALMIVFATIVVRSIAWPIYSKTNDMSLKMKLMQPELAKIEEKYAGRDDQASQQRKQQETMILYQKYGLGLSGCITPFIQFPLFLAFYETIQRVPYTISTAEVSYALDFGQFNHTIFGIDLFGTISAPGLAEAATQKTGIWILAILVALTQIVSQILVQVRQKREEKKRSGDVPEYRRPQASASQKSTNLTMQIMMYAMAVMMAVFVIRSAAGLGLYWLTGNLFSMFQSWISTRTQEKKMNKLKAKM